MVCLHNVKSKLINLDKILTSSLFLIQHDQDYHPGRRKRGKDYKEGMVEIIILIVVFECNRVANEYGKLTALILCAV